MSTSLRHQEIAILDFGSQYTHLIARRIRELSVFSRILPPDTPASELAGAAGIILSGGPQSVIDERINFDRGIFSLGIPVLGVCYGHQLMAHALGGSVHPGTTREYGLASLRIGGSKLFSDVGASTQVWMSHGDSVTVLPSGFISVGATADCPVAAMANEKKKLFGVQFHPEVTHTVQGMTILKNFILGICQAKQDWTQEAVLQEIEDEVRQQVGDRNVFLLVSGGVDSTVCFSLLERALGKDRVIGLHVDSGLMRYEESAHVRRALEQAGFANLRVVDARNDFFSAIAGIVDPEAKRRVIGETFLRVQEAAVRNLKLDAAHWLLGQGTIYPDTIETGRTAHADVIKTHHNRIPEIQRMVAEGRVVEPLKDLYKDEVRALGERIGIPHELVWRHPFPGPGLGIRILCASDQDHGQTVLAAESKDAEERVGDLLRAVRVQSFDTLVLPVRSVGVQGDQRSYRHPLVVADTRDIESVGRAAPRIANTLQTVNRILVPVAGDAKDILLATMHAATITKARVALLQRIDADVNDVIARAGLMERIWQFPIVLVPFGIDGKESIVLRPVASQEAMTANFFVLNTEVINSIVNACLSHPEIGFVFYDVTNKPPGTIEWE